MSFLLNVIFTLVFKEKRLGGVGGLDDKVGDGADELRSLSSGEIETSNPRAEDFQKTFDNLGIAPKLRASEYMRIILMGDASYDMYENATKQGAKLDGVERFEDSNTGITGKKEMLKALEHDLEFSSRKREHQPWIVISQSSYGPEVKEICERYVN